MRASRPHGQSWACASHTDRREAQDDAVPLPREAVRQAVQREDRHGHGRLETRLPGLDDRHEPEVGLQHETALGGLSINQRSAWFLAHRLRVALSEEGGVFSGPVEVDESYFGGRRRNMSNACRKELADTGGGAVSKTAVVGVKDRATKQVGRSRCGAHRRGGTPRLRHRPHGPRGEAAIAAD